MAGTSLFGFLDTLLPDEDQLPARVQLRVGGLTDLCSPKLDRAASNTEGELLQYLERAGPDSRFLCFFVDEAVAGYFGAWRVLSCAGRTVSCAEAFARKCPELRRGGRSSLHGCPRVDECPDSEDLGDLVLCRAGKHRSMLLAVCCYFVLWLVFKSTRRRVEISLDWTAGRRIIEETAASHTEGKPAAKHRFRQPNNVVNRAKERAPAPPGQP